MATMLVVIPKENESLAVSKLSSYSITELDIID